MPYSEAPDIATKPRHSDPELAKPKLYEVLLLNDDFTTMDFVIDVLVRFFHKNHQEAERLTLMIHHEGAAICAIYPKDIAEMRVTQVIQYAREHEYPLACTMQPH